MCVCVFDFCVHVLYVQTDMHTPTFPPGGATTMPSSRPSSPSSPTPSSAASAGGLDTWSLTACSAGKTH